MSDISRPTRILQPKLLSGPRFVTAVVAPYARDDQPLLLAWLDSPPEARPLTVDAINTIDIGGGNPLAIQARLPRLDPGRHVLRVSAGELDGESLGVVLLPREDVDLGTPFDDVAGALAALAGGELLDPALADKLTTILRCAQQDLACQDAFGAVVLTDAAVDLVAVADDGLFATGVRDFVSALMVQAALSYVVFLSITILSDDLLCKLQGKALKDYVDLLIRQLTAEIQRLRKKAKAKTIGAGEKLRLSRLKGTLKQLRGMGRNIDKTLLSVLLARESFFKAAADIAGILKFFADLLLDVITALIPNPLSGAKALAAAARLLRALAKLKKFAAKAKKLNDLAKKLDTVKDAIEKANKIKDKVDKAKKLKELQEKLKELQKDIEAAA